MTATARTEMPTNIERFVGGDNFNAFSREEELKRAQAMHNQNAHHLFFSGVEVGGKRVIYLSGKQVSVSVYPAMGISELRKYMEKNGI